MNSGRFAISVHILTLLCFSKDEWTPSDVLAGSININPALVRKELLNLRLAGLVVSKEGKSGGSRLAKSAAKIQMSEVYSAVRQRDLLGKTVNEPNPACPIGKQVNGRLDHLYSTAEQSLLASLEQVSLQAFCQSFL